MPLTRPNPQLDSKNAHAGVMLMSSTLDHALLLLESLHRSDVNGSSHRHSGRPSCFLPPCLSRSRPLQRAPWWTPSLSMWAALEPPTWMSSRWAPLHPKQTFWYIETAFIRANVMMYACLVWPMTMYLWINLAASDVNMRMLCFLHS